MAFPTTGILEDGSGADEDPLDTHWDGTHVFYPGDTGFFAKLSNQITDATGGGTDTSSSYDGVSGVQQFSGNIEVWATIVQVSTVTGDQFKIGAANARNDPNMDGYEVNIVKAAGADIVQIRRRDNVTPTTLGADMNQEISDGDSIGMEIIGSTISAYYKPAAGSWTLLGSRVDATYTGPWWIGVKTAQASPRAWKWVPFGGGTVSAIGPFDGRNRMLSWLS